MRLFLQYNGSLKEIINPSNSTTAAESIEADTTHAISINRKGRNREDSYSRVSNQTKEPRGKAAARNQRRSGPSFIKSHQLSLDSVRDCLKSIVGVQFLIDMMEMIPQSLRRDSQFAGNFR